MSNKKFAESERTKSDLESSKCIFWCIKIVKQFYGKKIIFPLKIGLGVILLYATFTKFDFSVFSKIDIKLYFLIITLTNSLFITALRSLKWDIILSQLYQQRHPFRRIFNLILIGQFFAFFTPSRTGDMIRAKYVKNKLGYKKSFSSVIIDKIFDIVSIGIFAILGFLYMRDKLIDLVDFHFAVAIPIIIVFFVLAILSAYIFRENLWKFYQILFDFGIRANKRIFFDVLLLSIIIWFLTYLQFYFVALMVNESPPFLDVISLSSVYTVILFLPISINGIGIREWMSAILFPLIGIQLEIGIIIAWIVAINNSLLPAVLGYLSLLRED